MNETITNLPNGDFETSGWKKRVEETQSATHASILGLPGAWLSDTEKCGMPVYPRGIHAPKLPESVQTEKSSKVPAQEFLEEALSVMKARATQRDAENGERSMAKTIALFNEYTGYKLSEADGWVFMVFLKMVRGKQGSFHKDDYVDGAAYFSLLGECESTLRAPRENTGT